VIPNFKSQISNPLPFYSGDWIVQRLCADAAGWVGTPFAAHSQVRGAGVDCIHLCAALYEATGFLDGFKPPAYAIDAGNHNAESQILEWLATNRQFRPVFARDADQPAAADLLQPGDLLLFRIAAVEHHCGVLLGRKRFIHARAGVHSTVTIDSLTDPIYRRCLTFAFRPLAPSTPDEEPHYKEVMG
jgi:cell wall-associated NlpC family hydrolase